jgi:malate dehydrogenase (oxaloacetate-decarboxylating)(NADP+)
MSTIIAVRAGKVAITDEMFMSAALALAKLVNDSDLEQGSLYPALPRIREVSARIAAEVAQVAYKRDLIAGEVPDDAADARHVPHVRTTLWQLRIAWPTA